MQAEPLILNIAPGIQAEDKEMWFDTGEPHPLGLPMIEGSTYAKECTHLQGRSTTRSNIDQIAFPESTLEFMETGVF
ncbi:hypothetical protein NLI96_g8913 [Meripilus lineatus]|uniref:Uncharacterized protein n=1 Tax=Meripilus lineatus TaxID=2056292 RepID=A0AAD5YFU9_9APHY|nr:hypothetical protein NLI96_g8913 [Physisporinus lineatus]